MAGEPQVTTALTIGTFDLLHPGHVELFADCRRLVGPEGRVVVGVNSDDFVKRYRGAEPVMLCWQRMQLVAALRNVDAVVVNHQHDSTVRSLLGQLDFGDYLVIGSDWLERDYLGQIGVTVGELAAAHIALVYSPRRSGGPSSTELKRRLVAL